MLVHFIYSLVVWCRNLVWLELVNNPTISRRRLHGWNDVGARHCHSVQNFRFSPYIGKLGGGNGPRCRLKKENDACNLVDVVAAAIGQGFPQVKSPTSGHTHKQPEGVDTKSWVEKCDKLCNQPSYEWNRRLNGAAFTPWAWSSPPTEPRQMAYSIATMQVEVALTTRGRHLRSRSSPSGGWSSDNLTTTLLNGRVGLPTGYFEQWREGKGKGEGGSRVWERCDGKTCSLLLCPFTPSTSDPSCSITTVCTIHTGTTHSP
jgi:hypothetical protein